LRNNQTSPSHATQETDLWVSPHPKNNSPLPIPYKNLLWKGVGLPHPPFLTQKKPKKKEKILNLFSSFLKTPLTTYNSFNLIELSTPYTHQTPIIKNKPMKKGKKKYFNPFAFKKNSPINPTLPPSNIIN